MKHLIIPALLCSSLAFIPPTHANNSTAPNSQMNQKNNPSQSSDPEAFAKLITLDKNEINAAKEALKRSSAPAVKAYAHLMIKDHGEHLKDVRKLAHKLHLHPVASDKSISLKKDGEDEIKQLKSTTKNEFDKTYIDAMVKDHQNGLDLIDNDLMQSVSNPQFKNLLKLTREKVNEHLEKAKKIQDQMK